MDAAGHLWVSAARPPAAPPPGKWHVFDPEGIYLGVVDLPPGLELQEVGADYVLGVVRDDFDVPRVMLHDLIKP